MVRERFNKRATRRVDGVDRISELPDEIIVIILSFLSLKEAAATSVVSLRWVDLWKHTPNLNFTISIFKFNSRALSVMDATGSWNADRCKYVKLVNSVIQSHKAPSLKQFTISFYVNKSATCVVAIWLQFACSRGVERLALDFNCRKRMYVVVLEDLLRECGLCSSSQTLILFKSLKRMYLKQVIVNRQAVKIFLRNCPLLEELIITKSVVTSAVEVCGATLLLKHLEVSHCHGGKSLRVSARNLTRLKFIAVHGELFLESVPKLVEAEFRFERRNIDLVQNVAPALFHLSSKLEILNLCLVTPKEFLANEFPEMPNLRKLVIEYYGVKTHSLLPVTDLLWASPRLQEFKLVFKEQQNFLNGDEATEVRRNGERCGHLHLKLFELEGLVNGADGHIELVTYISNNCVGLEKIKIFLGRSLPISVVRHEWSLSVMLNGKQPAGNYAHQHLHGKLPQHIQLHFS